MASDDRAEPGAAPKHRAGPATSTEPRPLGVAAGSRRRDRLSPDSHWSGSRLDRDARGVSGWWPPAERGTPGSAQGGGLMRRDQLEHAIRIACQIIGRPEVIVLGSQAILGTFREDE